MVVLGATGRVGRLILAEWLARPPERLQVRTQMRGTGQTGTIGWELADGPQGGPQALAASIGQARVLVVLSGVTPAPGADYRLNVALALAAVQAGALCGARHLFIASSAAVYGSAGPGPLSERVAPNPVSDYGRAKLAMELACTRWLDQAPQPKPGVTFLRIGNVVGTDQFFRNLARASPQTPLLLDQFADGTGPVRSYIGPASLARTLACLCRRAAAGAPLPLVLNIGAPAGGIDMAAFIPALLARGHPAPVIRAPAPPAALPALRLSTHLLDSLCPIDPAEGTAAAMVQQWLALRGAR